jgi:hypothetical protein
MSDTPDDEVQAAFPDRYRDGMTLRDYFAAQALSGLINYSPEPTEHKAIAELCYSLADAMMKARGA